MTNRRLMTVLVTTPVLIAAALAAPTAAQATPTPKAIPHTRPTWLAHARHLGHAQATAAVHARVYLAPKTGVAAVRQAALAVATPGNAAYRHFLTPAQYRAQYGPTTAMVRSVSAWLRSSGLAVTGVEAHNRYVSVSGTVAAAQRAFGTAIERYSHDGHTVQAPASSLTAPATVAASILTVTGLDTTPHRVAPTRTASAPPPPSFRNARPCSLYYGQVKAKYQADFHTPLPTFNGKVLPYAPCGYTGPQFRAAYEGNSTLDGSGVTVAITDAYAAPTIEADANTYAARHGDGTYAPGQFSQWTAGHFTHSNVCGESGWYGEETLDVEAVHAMAPGANIRYYGAASCFDDDLLTALQQVVDDDEAQLVTNSWGDVEQNATADTVAAYEDIFMQGSLQGISFMFSSGDNGDELANTGLLQTDYPTSDPWVTSVGGTSTAIGATGALSWQTGWGTEKYSLSTDGTAWNPVGFLYGAGGGESSLFNQPDYQSAVLHGAYRAVPDVAMDGDPTTGMLIGETQTFPDGVHYGEYRIGGTSLSSPLFAGMTALALQSGDTSVGLLNPSIYANATTGVFTDVKGAPRDAGDVRVDFVNGNDKTDGLVYSVRAFNQDSSLSISRGWDDVTGLGSPNTGWLTAFTPAP